MVRMLPQNKENTIQNSLGKFTMETKSAKVTEVQLWSA